MNKTLQRRFIAGVYRVAKFGGAIIFVWGVIGFVEQPRALDQYFTHGMMVIFGYLLSFGGVAQKMIDDYGPDSKGAANCASTDTAERTSQRP